MKVDLILDHWVYIPRHKYLELISAVSSDPGEERCTYILFYCPSTFWPFQKITLLKAADLRMAVCTLIVIRKTGQAMLETCTHLKLAVNSLPHRFWIAWILKSRECKDEGVRLSMKFGYLWADNRFRLCYWHTHYQRPYISLFCLTLTIVLRGLDWMLLSPELTSWKRIDCLCRLCGNRKWPYFLKGFWHVLPTLGKPSLSQALFPELMQCHNCYINS